MMDLFVTYHKHEKNVTKSSVLIKIRRYEQNWRKKKSQNSVGLFKIKDHLKYLQDVLKIK